MSNIANWLILANSVIALITALVVAWNRKDVLDVKKATDGMKDELVNTTSALKLKEGEAIGRAAGEAKAAVLAMGREQARQEAEKKVIISAEVVALPLPTETKSEK